MTLGEVRRILEQALELSTIESIYFEGGEPFLYYATLLAGVQEAASAGFGVGIVTNAYWATSEEDAEAALRPFAGLIQDLSISSDLYHYSEKLSLQAKNAIAAAKLYGIPTGVISVARPESQANQSVGQLAEGESAVMVRGRAVEKLAGSMPLSSWDGFKSCPHEDLRDPGRVHVDPLGYLHICQGITVGNLFRTPLVEIVGVYDPDTHPIVGPLLRGGPAELVRYYGLAHEQSYADACHLCDAARRALRGRFPDILGPDQMYGVADDG